MSALWLYAALSIAALLGSMGGYAYGVSRNAQALSVCIAQAAPKADDSALRHFSEAPPAPIQGKRW